MSVNDNALNVAVTSIKIHLFTPLTTDRPCCALIISLIGLDRPDWPGRLGSDSDSGFFGSSYPAGLTPTVREWGSVVAGRCRDEYRLAE